MHCCVWSCLLCDPAAPSLVLAASPRKPRLRTRPFFDAATRASVAGGTSPTDKGPAKQPEAGVDGRSAAPKAMVGLHNAAPGATASDAAGAWNMRDGRSHHAAQAGSSNARNWRKGAALASYDAAAVSRKSHDPWTKALRGGKGVHRSWASALGSPKTDIKAYMQATPGKRGRPGRGQASHLRQSRSAMAAGGAAAFSSISSTMGRGLFPGGADAAAGAGLGGMGGLALGLRGTEDFPEDLSGIGAGVPMHLMQMSGFGNTPTPDPVASGTSPEDSAAASHLANPWRLATDPASGRTYYYHPETRETSWVYPAFRTDKVGPDSPAHPMEALSPMRRSLANATEEPRVRPAPDPSCRVSLPSCRVSLPSCSMSRSPENV